MIYKYNFIKAVFPALIFFLFSCNIPKKLSVAAGWKLVWGDEFSKDGLPDSTRWDYDTGTGCPDVCGWGNNELQYYTKEDTNNAVVKNGKLFIKALKQTKENSNYTSARLITKHKGDWLYGRIEVKAKLPAGRGIWPAIWMLPTDWEYGGWPSSGEIDIMENVGHNPDTVFSSVHTKTFNHSIGTQKTKGLKVTDVHTAFHLYAIEWYKDRIDFFIDDNFFFSFKNTSNGFAEWPYDKKFHLLLNIAVGGNWGGQKGIDETIFPGVMEVDYVRVYQQQQ
jgi:beta-glucanase (GH16 family)